MSFCVCSVFVSVIDGEILSVMTVVSVIDGEILSVMTVDLLWMVRYCQS
jgi:hypothetical protein